MVGLRFSDAAPLTTQHLSFTHNHNPNLLFQQPPPPPPNYATNNYQYGGRQQFDGRGRQAFTGQGGRQHEYSSHAAQQEEERRSYHRHAWSRPSCSDRLYPSTPPQEWQLGQQYSGNWYAPPVQYPAPQQTLWQHQYLQPLTQPYTSAAPQQYSTANSQLNANVPAFTPVNQQISGSVIPTSLLKRLGIDKTARYSQANPGPVPAVPVQEKKKKKGGKTKREKRLERLAASAENDQDQTSLLKLWARAAVPEEGFSDLQGLGDQSPVTPQPATEKPARKGKYDPRAAKRVMIMQRPVPTPAYLHFATQDPQVLEISRPLLVILDLNGTLLFRKNFGGNNAFTARPHVYQFLEYLFSNHTVMVWSSSKPENVRKMCSDLFTPEQRSKLPAVWGRDTLRIPPHAYNQRVQVYKQLSWVWNDLAVQASNPVPGGVWTQANTVLIDDTIEKAAGEPYNLIELEEFEAKKEQMSTDVLGQVALYLNDLRSQRDVSAYMRLHPFVYDSRPPARARGQKKSDTPIEGMSDGR